MKAQVEVMRVVLSRVLSLPIVLAGLILGWPWLVLEWIFDPSKEKDEDSKRITLMFRVISIILAESAWCITVGLFLFGLGWW